MVRYPQSGEQNFDKENLQLLTAINDGDFVNYNSENHANNHLPTTKQKV